MKIRGAIFDMDGVLFDTERIYQRIWREIAAARHIELDSSFPAAISGTNGAQMRQIVEDYYQVSDGTDIIDECTGKVKEELTRHVPMKEGVLEILHFLQEKKIPMAVASSSSIQQIAFNLEKADIRGYFAEIVSGRQVAHGKPAPDIFLYAAERIKQKPAECLVFEDSKNGVRAGYEAGCMTIMVPDIIEPTPDIIPCCFRICASLTEAQRQIERLL